MSDGTQMGEFVTHMNESHHAQVKGVQLYITDFERPITGTNLFWLILVCWFVCGGIPPEGGAVRACLFLSRR